MPLNPLQNDKKFDAANTGQYRVDMQNNTRLVRKLPHSTFDNSFDVLQTARFGEVKPFAAIMCEPDDVHTLRDDCRIRTFTLKSPISDMLNYHRAFYQVPLSSILPNTYELFYANPQKGDDVPDDVYTEFAMPFMSLFNIMAYQLFGVAPSSVTEEVEFVSDAVHQPLRALEAFALLAKIATNDSLMSNMGCSTKNMLFFQGKTLDEWIDTKWMQGTFDLSTSVTGCRIDRVILMFYDDQSNPVSRTYYNTALGRRALLDVLARHAGEIEELTVQFTYGQGTKNQQNLTSSYSKMITGFIPREFFDFSNLDTGTLNIRPFSVDHLPLVAYQQSVAQFITVDFIDQVYTSKLWMQNMQSLQDSIIDIYIKNNSASLSKTFSYNGVNVPYDIFSSHNMSYMYAFIATSTYQTLTYQDQLKNFLGFISNLYMPAESLLYGDYFTGGRLEPLAVGNVAIDVSGDSVSALDITRNLQVQRFLNKINRTGSQIQDYILGLFGVTPVAVTPQPKYISYEVQGISGSEVDSTVTTGLAPEQQQGYPTLLLNSQNSKYAFEVYVSDPSVIIGVEWFSLKRYYVGAIWRDFFRRNRFDYFQPDLQNVGDQALYVQELGHIPNNDIGSLDDLTAEAFAYHLRDTHFKQRYDIATGGFSRQDVLPSWANIFDFSENQKVYLSSDFIRNYNTLLDKFYASLTGVSDTSYFHFMLTHRVTLTSSRPMQAKPLIQG